MAGLLVLIGASSVRVSWSDPSSVPPAAACWSIKRVSTRPWPSVRPVLRPRALTVNKSWILDAFDACVGICRVSGVHGLNVPSPLCPPHAHSYHGVYLQIMDPPSSAGPPNDHDDRVSGTHRLKSPAPLAPASRVPGTACSFFLCSFHLGASTTTTTTIVTTPRRQATTGNHIFHVTQGNRLFLGRDVNLSPPGLVEDKPDQVSPSPVLSRLNGMSSVMETLCSKGSDTSFLSVSLC